MRSDLQQLHQPSALPSALRVSGRMSDENDENIVLDEELDDETLKGDE